MRLFRLVAVALAACLAVAGPAIAASTTNLGIAYPTPGADESAWGTILNSALQSFDDEYKVATLGDASLTADSTTRIVRLTTALTAPRTITLPAASTRDANKPIVVVDPVGAIGATNTLTIARAGSDTINGATSYVLNSAYPVLVLRSDGTSKWNAFTGSTFSAGTTGLTPSSATSGAITLGGTLNVANGGTGTTTSTGSGSVVLGTSPTIATPTLNGAPTLGSASGWRTALGLGTAATQSTGTSGANVPLLNGSNTWSATQTLSASSSGTYMTLSNSTAATSWNIYPSGGTAGTAGVGFFSSNFGSSVLTLNPDGSASFASPSGWRSGLGVTATGSDTTYAYRANNLSDLANAATARTNLGLGSIATQASSSVSITGGAISGLTSLANTGDSTLGDANSDTTTVNGHLQVSGTAPTVSSCGTSPAVSSNSNDNRGSITAGSGTVTSCVLTFSRAWAVAPFCIATPFQTTPSFTIGLSAFTTTSVTFTFSGNFASTAFMYHCEG